MSRVFAATKANKLEKFSAPSVCADDKQGVTGDQLKSGAGNPFASTDVLWDKKDTLRIVCFKVCNIKRVELSRRTHADINNKWGKVRLGVTYTGFGDCTLNALW